MNKLNSILWLSATYILIAGTLIISGCNADDVEIPSTRPEVTEEDSGKISSFTLQKGHFDFPDNTDAVSIALISPDGDTRCFNADVEHLREELRFHMTIPSPEEIADGSYIMTMRRHDGKNIPGRLSALFEDGMLASVKIIIPTYMLDGSGTEDDPYLIQSSEDFEMFLMNLGDDKDVYGAGLKFKQTADVKAPDQSSMIAGRGYWGAPFAGIYDGGGHEVRGLYYRGNGRADSDSFIGLFNDLRGNASVSHLSITEVSVSGLYKWSGIVAGYTTGNISMTDISVNGNFADGYAMGGVVGVLKSGSLTISNVELHAIVNGSNDIGGIIGLTESGTTLTVEHVSTPDTHFIVSGHHSVGGIVGRAKGNVNISDVRLNHKVSSEDSDIKIIAGTGEGVGGIIGNIDNPSHACNISDCRVLCPIGGPAANSTGGIFGKINTQLDLNVTECRFQSVLEGNKYVGGFAGYAAFPTNVNSGVLHIQGDDFSTRVSADDADAKVTGVDCVGGFIGYYEGGLDLQSKVKINLPVRSTGSDCGGIFGRIMSATPDITKFMVGQDGTTTATDNNMKVSGHSNVGGLIGTMRKSSITGSGKFDYAEGGNSICVPDKGRFIPACTCVVTGDDNVGGLVGYAEESGIFALSSAAHITGSGNVGGIVGALKKPYVGGTALEDCVFMGIINCSKASNVGGIVGYTDAVWAMTIHDCINYSPVTGGDCTGGIAGYACKSERSDGKEILDIKWCVNKGDVTGSIHVGGIVGRTFASSPYLSTGDSNESTSINITHSMNAGRIYGSSSSNDGGIGGIVGFTNYVTGVMYCANHGDIYGDGAFHGIGGIAGSMGEDPTGSGVTHTFRNVMLRESCNTGSIDAGDSSSAVGGILGYQEEGNKSDVEDCHNLGKVLPNQKHDCGGIVGCVDHLTNIYRCVNQGKVEHGNAMIGTHKSGSLFDHGSLYFLEGTGKNWPSATSVSAAHFTVQSYFDGLDFNYQWTMTSDGPVLLNNHWRDPSRAR